MARAIDADRLKQAIDHDYYEHYTKYHDSDQTALIDMVMDDIDEMPTLTQPNEPLTLEQLREMDGEPVWFDTIKRWGIVRVCGYGISVLTKSGEYDVTRMKFYRRPPEGEEYT